MFLLRILITGGLGFIGSHLIDSLPLEYFDKIQNIAIEYHAADSKPELAKDLISKIKNAGFTIKTRPHHNDMGFLIAKK